MEGKTYEVSFREEGGRVVGVYSRGKATRIEIAAEDIEELEELFGEEFCRLYGDGEAIIQLFPAETSKVPQTLVSLKWNGSLYLENVEAAFEQVCPRCKHPSGRRLDVPFVVSGNAREDYCSLELVGRDPIVAGLLISEKLGEAVGFSKDELLPVFRQDGKRSRLHEIRSKQQTPRCALKHGTVKGWYCKLCGCKAFHVDTPHKYYLCDLLRESERFALTRPIVVAECGIPWTVVIRKDVWLALKGKSYKKGVSADPAFILPDEELTDSPDLPEYEVMLEAHASLQAQIRKWVKE
jgi:hypothetical protein